MKLLARYAAAADRAPDGALVDALAMAALCVMVVAGFTAAGLG